MTEPTARPGDRFLAAQSRGPGGQPANLADLLERVLDKGIVIAGDIRVNLLDIELLTIKIRLLIASVDRAREMGIDWWEHDPSLSSGKRDLALENRRLRERIGELEAGRSGRRTVGTAAEHEDDGYEDDAYEDGAHGSREYEDREAPPVRRRRPRSTS
ncbi:gas vesicle protein [Streptomyces sp. NRRL B-24484]|uniref:gas vesicle protein n=1 Tax=Streptomyces sp. NRRL B-24484 TaxID=1463833 RepID=UPI000693D6B1|nr:gas vesicle protein [Streptomyces sp. NRRL B-24484]